MGVFARGRKLWVRYKDDEGRWLNEPTGYSVGQEADAEKCLARLEELTSRARLAKNHPPALPSTTHEGPLTVGAYVERWLEERRELKLASWSDDAARLRLHVVPIIGEIALSMVSPKHIKIVIMHHRKASRLAPRSIRHVFGVMSTMFKDAVADELIRSSPCVLRKGVLPKKMDKDPEWRATAIFDRDELIRLVSDRSIPQDRRVLYAFKGLAGLRHGEAARLRFEQIAPQIEPLGSIHLGKTKSGVPRAIPIHPALRQILHEWAEAGWERIFGRAPKPADLIVPTRNMTARESPESQEALLGDLQRLGLRPRRGHDLRRTLVTLARSDGADKHVLEAITHGPRGDIVNLYTTYPWDVMCRELGKLKIELPSPSLPPVPESPTRYSAVTGEENLRNRWTKTATPAGFEPAFVA